MKELYKQLKQVENELAEKERAFSESIKHLRKQALDLRTEINERFISEQRYLPMSELKRYEGKIIDSLHLILDNGEDFYFSHVYGITVKDGKLVPLGSDDDDREFWYDKGYKGYIGYGINHRTPIRPVGFFQVVLFDEKTWGSSNNIHFVKGKTKIPCSFDNQEYFSVDEITTKDFLIGGINV